MVTTHGSHHRVLISCHHSPRTKISHHTSNNSLEAAVKANLRQTSISTLFSAGTATKESPDLNTGTAASPKLDKKKAMTSQPHYLSKEERKSEERARSFSYGAQRTTGRRNMRERARTRLLSCKLSGKEVVFVLYVISFQLVLPQRSFCFVL